jgi:hypothetical protein
MSHRIEHPTAASAPSLTVRAVAGQLRVIPVWQALGPHAVHAKSTRIRCGGKHNIDEMTVLFEAVGVDDLAEIPARLKGQPWVVTASLQGETP